MNGYFYKTYTLDTLLKFPEHLFPQCLTQDWTSNLEAQSHGETSGSQLQDPGFSTFTDENNGNTPHSPRGTQFPGERVGTHTYLGHFSPGNDTSIFTSHLGNILFVLKIKGNPSNCPEKSSNKPHLTVTVACLRRKLAAYPGASTGQGHAHYPRPFSSS